MNKKNKLQLIIISILIILLANITVAETPTIKEYQKENTYVLAPQQNIETTINGDLFLLTAESNIEGTINKDLNAISSKINIQGIIGDDLRIIAMETKLNVYVFNELRIITDKIETSNTTIINGKTTIKATNAKIQGTYNEDVTINTQKLELNAIINGNAKLTGQIIINPETRINGNLEVTKGTNIPENVVKGTITYTEKPRITTKELLLGKITLLLIIIILAALIHITLQKPTDKIIETTTQKPIKTLLIGILTIILLPTISLILLISVITAPIGLLLILGLMAVLIITPAFTALLIGKQIMEMIRPRREIRLEILIGALTLVMLSFIPGFMILATILFYALLTGTTILLLIPKRKKKAKKSKKKK
ncbi:hypothetical protein KO361_06220 [Candidatus Woesearchaeota archaeon]|nr:hypothetical protein [Candidatus Woesearchaeota archaeon]